MIGAITRRFKVPLPAALILSILLPADIPAQQVLTLDESLRIAMEKSPNIKRARYNLERSEASLNAANARLKSQFSLSITPISYTNYTQFNPLFATYYTEETTRSFGTFQVEQPIKWTDGTLTLKNDLSWRDSYSEFNNQSIRNYRNDLYLSFQQPLFTYNRTKQELRELELDLENTRLSYTHELLTLEQQVMQQFYSVYEAKMSLEIAMEDFNNKQNAYYIMKDKVDAGLETREQLYQSEVNLANSQSTVQNGKVQLENTKDEFIQLLGLSLFEDVNISADVSFRPVEVPLEWATEHGLKYRTEIRQREIAIENARMDIIRTGAQNEFRGDVNLSYGTSSTATEFGNIYNQQDENQQFSVSFTIPLWDWGEKKHSIKASETTLHTRELDLEELRKDVVIEIRKTYRELENQVIQIDITRQSVRNAQLTYEISLEKYKNGDLTSKTLGEIQTQLSQAKNNEISALIKYKLLLQEMKILSLWDFEKSESVIEEM